VGTVAEELFCGGNLTQCHSCLVQKGDQHSVGVGGDIQNNPTFADFSYYIRMAGFLAPKFQTLAISVLLFQLS